MMSGFPQSIDDIDAAWFGTRLARQYPGTAVTRLERGTVIRGTATKVEYFLDYNAAGSSHCLPPSLWLKCGLDMKIPEQAAHSTIEAHFFRDLAPRLEVNMPRPYATEVAPDQSSGIVIYEDLNRRPVTFGNPYSEVAPATMLRVLEMLADLHAAFWRSPELRKLSWLTPGGVIHSANVLDQFLGFWDHASHQPRWGYIADELKDREMIGEAIHTLMRDDIADPICLVHADPHAGNQFFDADGRPGLIDWATVMHGNWAWDVTYAIVSPQTVEQRRSCEKEQIAHYLKRLRQLGVEAPDFATAWREYSRHAVYIFNFGLCPIELQPEDMCIRNSERASAAIVDLQSVKALLGT